MEGEKKDGNDSLSMEEPSREMMPPSVKNILHCKNCASAFEGEFCPNCSQSRRANFRLSMKNVVMEYLRSVFNFDKGLWFTFWNLIKKPHFVAQSFIDGKRKQFTNPVKFFVISTILQALLSYLFSNDFGDFPHLELPFLTEELNLNMKHWNEVMTFDYPILLGIINTLIWTVLLFMFFKNSKYNFTELLVSSLYFYGTIFILINLFSIAYRPLVGKFLPVSWVSLIGFGYMTFAYANFFKGFQVIWRILRIVFVFVGLFVFRMLVLPLLLGGLFPIN